MSSRELLSSYLWNVMHTATCTLHDWLYRSVISTLCMREGDKCTFCHQQ